MMDLRETALRLALEFHQGTRRSATEVSSRATGIEDAIASATKILEFLNGAGQKDEVA